jgi:alkylresorcinol/alkylpyrone synthase
MTAPHTSPRPLDSHAHRAPDTPSAGPLPPLASLAPAPFARAGAAPAPRPAAARAHAPAPEDPRAPRIAAVATAFPPHRYSQSELTAALRAHWGERPGLQRLEMLHGNCGVGHRHLALPVEEYPALRGFGDANDAFIRVGTDLAERALQAALDEAGLAPRDVDAVFFTTVTGVAAPTIDARLMNRVRLRPDVKRTPLFGLGCVAGAAGLARAADYLRAFPDHVAVLIAVELCSLTIQSGDGSLANQIASGLFGDGAAAVVLAGAGRAPAHGDAAGARAPRVVASRSRFYPDSEDVMGWKIGETGFRIVLSAGVPEVVRRYLADDVRAFLAERGLTTAEIARWICHPGGPKVLDAVRESLALPEDALALSWRSLAETGNLSSASVLSVLRATLVERRPEPGARGLVAALGPGFCSELVLLRW